MNEIQKTDNLNTSLDQFDKFDNWFKLGGILIKSGFLPKSVDKPEKFVAIVLAGKELNIPPMTALRTIDVINGVPTMKPQMMLAKVRKSGLLEDMKIEKLEKSVKVTVIRKGESPITTEFGDTEAVALQLINKDNYRKQKFNMYTLRALSANLRLTFPDVINGLYTPEEIDPTIKMIEDADFEEIEMPEPEPIDIYNECKKSLEELPSQEGFNRKMLDDWVAENKSKMDGLSLNMKGSLQRAWEIVKQKLPKEEPNGTVGLVEEQSPNDTKTS